LREPNVKKKLTREKGRVCAGIKVLDHQPKDKKLKEGARGPSGGFGSKNFPVGA